jgi:hypothetical protein
MCEFYDASSCTTENITDYSCVPSCLSDCGDVFCDSFSKLSFLCAEPSKVVDYRKALAIEKTCLGSFMQGTTTETALQFNVSVVFGNVTVEEFRNDTEAQNATIRILTDIMGGDPAVVIYEINPYFLNSGNNNTNSTTRLLYSIDSTGQYTEVVFGVTVIIEQLGFSSQQALLAFLDLKASLSDAFLSRYIVQTLKDQGFPIFRTSLFEREFDSSILYFSEASVNYVKTAMPSSQPSLAPTDDRSTKSTATTVGGFNIYIVIIAASFIFLCCIVWTLWFCCRKKNEKKYSISQVAVDPDDYKYDELDDRPFGRSIKAPREELFEVYSPEMDLHMTQEKKSLKHKAVFDVSPSPDTEWNNSSFGKKKLVLPPIGGRAVEHGYSPHGPRLAPLEPMTPSPMKKQVKRKRNRRPPDSELAGGSPGFIESDAGVLNRSMSGMSGRGASVRVPPGGGYTSDADPSGAVGEAQGDELDTPAAPGVVTLPSPDSRKKSVRTGISSRSPGKSSRSVRIPPGGDYTGGGGSPGNQLFDRTANASTKSGAGLSESEDEQRRNAAYKHQQTAARAPHERPNEDVYTSGPAHLFNRPRVDEGLTEDPVEEEDKNIPRAKTYANDMPIPNIGGEGYGTGPIEYGGERRGSLYQRTAAPPSRARSAKTPSSTPGGRSHSPSAKESPGGGPRGHRATRWSRKKGPAPDDEEDITDFAQTGALTTRKQMLWGGDTPGSPLQHPFGGRRAVSQKLPQRSSPGGSNAYTSNTEANDDDYDRY